MLLRLLHSCFITLIFILNSLFPSYKGLVESIIKPNCDSFKRLKNLLTVNLFIAFQIPKAIGAIDTFLTTGPLCRYASDLMPMFKVLLKDDVKKSNLLRLNERVDLRGIKLFYMENDGGDLLFSSPVHEDLR